MIYTKLNISYKNKMSIKEKLEMEIKYRGFACNTITTR
mgnify:CR=1 FL=1